MLSREACGRARTPREQRCGCHRTPRLAVPTELPQHGTDASVGGRVRWSERYRTLCIA